MAVTGGTVTDLNGYRYHVFDTTDTISADVPTVVDALVVAGGGGGGGEVNTGGAGGGGGLIPWTEITLDGTEDVSVGAGGTGQLRSVHGVSGLNSAITHTGGTLTAVGGGGGASDNCGDVTGYAGGSGGGGGAVGAGGSGTSGQGYAGGWGATNGINWNASGGGGGYTSAGTNAHDATGGNGGQGWTVDTDLATITGMSTFSSGGAGESQGGNPGTPGTGAGTGHTSATMYGCGGGGSGINGVPGGNGFQGVVVVRYPIPSTPVSVASDLTIPVNLTATPRIVKAPVDPILAQARETAIVNRALTPLAPRNFSGLCLNADISLNGLTFNTIDEFGVVWIITDIDGWWTHPDPEVKDYPRGSGDGSYDARGRWLARNLTLNGVFLPPDPSFVPIARDTLIRATNIVHSGAWLRVAETPLKTSYVRLSGKPSISTVNARGRTEFSIGLRAANPIKYDWNNADPDGYGSVTIPCRDLGGATGSGSVENIGNTAVHVLLQITGPITGPATVMNVTTGELIIIIGGIGPGDMLEIDTYRQEVALNGETAGMRSALDPATDWIRLTPGENALAFEDVGDVHSTAQMTVLYRSGWIG